MQIDHKIEGEREKAQARRKRMMFSLPCYNISYAATPSLSFKHKERRLASFTAFLFSPISLLFFCGPLISFTIARVFFYESSMMKESIDKILDRERFSEQEMLLK